MRQNVMKRNSQQYNTILQKQGTTMMKCDAIQSIAVSFNSLLSV